MDWIYIVILIAFFSLVGGFLISTILMIINEQSGLTNKRKDKYFKNKEKQIIEQLEFEKRIFVRKVKIEKRIYRYVYYTWGIVYPQLFVTLDELVEHIEKLEKKGKI